MGMLYLFFIISLIIVRFLAGYDSRFHKRKYIEINNKIIRGLLIDETSFFERRKRLKKDINKMTVLGLVLYIVGIVTLVVGVALHCLAPNTPVEPWKIETDNFIMYVDTLNEKLSAVFLWLFPLAVLWCIASSLLLYAKTTEKKWVRWIVYIVSFTLFIAILSMTCNMIKELIMCFL